MRITDLGYFNLTVVADMTQEGEYFLSRLLFGTSVMLPDGKAVELLKWLAQQPGPFVDPMILLGKEQHLSCRLIAWRLSAVRVRSGAVVAAPRVASQR